MNILFVCMGNTCRSPMAEYVMKNKIKNYITVFLGCIVIVSGFVNQLNGIFEVNAEKNIRTIIIDPGHGGLTNTIKV